ncbi:hypothetical protein LEM8419_03080 [Neolewinella maritima]|uniref:Putative restriction endonuclease domain-containing protein n=1 Tax=Neolewinella maritima TaxID=1383882 RepID=A0ABM9B4A5_9BACT|nr:Uma2 family endonuclease [Neolewinella maritima]CAH1002163.1 hypothetical protein LEM8419_03080 [Neolewinella maritima]
MVAVKVKLPIEQYLEVERQGEVRLEYHHGDLYAMAGGTINHTTLCTNVSAILLRETKRRGEGCRTFNSELKVEIEEAAQYVYPDATVVCGPVKESDKIMGAICNPTLVVEVVSDSSGDYDRGAKMRYYLSLSSIQEYLVIEQDRPAVTIYRRQGPGTLGRYDYADGLDSSIVLECIGVTLLMAELYADVDFGDSPVFPPKS